MVDQSAKAVAGRVSDWLCPSWNPKPFGVYWHSGFLGISPAVIWGYRATPRVFVVPSCCHETCTGRVPISMCTFFIPYHCKPGMCLRCLELTIELPYISYSQVHVQCYLSLCTVFGLSYLLQRHSHRLAVMRSWGRLFWAKKGQARCFSKTVFNDRYTQYY